MSWRDHLMVVGIYCLAGLVGGALAVGIGLTLVAIGSLIFGWKIA